MRRQAVDLLICYIFTPNSRGRKHIWSQLLPVGSGRGCCLSESRSPGSTGILGEGSPGELWAHAGMQRRHVCAQPGGRGRAGCFSCSLDTRSSWYSRDRTVLAQGRGRPRGCPDLSLHGTRRGRCSTLMWLSLVPTPSSLCGSIILLFIKL